MIENFRFWFIMPSDADTRKPDLGAHPVGTGAFQFKNFVKGDRLELERFPDYWNDGRPYLDSLTFATDSDAPGATPRIRMVQPRGSGDAGLTKSARS